MIQGFEVVQEFSVIEPFSGRSQRIKAGKIIEVDTSPEPDLLAFEMESQTFLESGLLS